MGDEKIKGNGQQNQDDSGQSDLSVRKAVRPGVFLFLTGSGPGGQPGVAASGLSPGPAGGLYRIVFFKVEAALEAIPGRRLQKTALGADRGPGFHRLFFFCAGASTRMSTGTFCAGPVFFLTKKPVTALGAGTIRPPSGIEPALAL